MRQRMSWISGYPLAWSFWIPRNRMREIFTSGSVGGAVGNNCSYPAVNDIDGEGVEKSLEKAI